MLVAPLAKHGKSLLMADQLAPFGRGHTFFYGLDLHSATGFWYRQLPEERRGSTKRAKVFGKILNSFLALLAVLSALCVTAFEAIGVNPTGYSSMPSSCFDSTAVSPRSRQTVSFTCAEYLIHSRPDKQRKY